MHTAGGVGRELHLLLDALVLGAVDEGECAVGYGIDGTAAAALLNSYIGRFDCAYVCTYNIGSWT